LHIMFISCFTMGKAHMQGTFPKRGAGLKLPPHPWAQPQWAFPRCGGWTQLVPGETFPKCRAVLNYHLIVGPAFQVCPHPHVLSYTNQSILYDAPGKLE